MFGPRLEGRNGVALVASTLEHFQLHPVWETQPEVGRFWGPRFRSEEQRLNSSHGYISYAVFCLKKKTSPGEIVAAARLHRRPSLGTSFPQFAAFSGRRVASPLWILNSSAQNPHSDASGS